jgi:hypothetical protein
MRKEIQWAHHAAYAVRPIAHLACSIYPPSAKWMLPAMGKKISIAARGFPPKQQQRLRCKKSKTQSPAQAALVRFLCQDSRRTGQRR